MSFTYEEFRVSSLYIDKIWHTHTTSDGVYTAGLDGNWDIIISRYAETVSVMVTGVGKGAVQVPYTAGIESIGIALRPGVFLRDLHGKDIVDSQHVLSQNGSPFVEIGGHLFKIPDFATAKSFVDELIVQGVLLINPLVSSFTTGNAKASSDRSLRRHVIRVTGLSPYFFHQIQRAQHATQLLQQGTSIAQAAVEAGYTDQAHMTKAVKQLMGRTPAQIVAASQKK